MITLGSVHVLSCAVVYAIVAITAQKTLAARPRAALAVTRLAGFSMIAISLVLLVTQFLHDQRQPGNSAPRSVFGVLSRPSTYVPNPQFPRPVAMGRSMQGAGVHG